MTYSEAHKKALDGSLIAMKNWNGKGMYCFALYLKSIDVDTLPKNAREIFRSMQVDVVEINPSMCMLGADGRLTIGWAPSQIDQFSEDWIEIFAL